MASKKPIRGVTPERLPLSESEDTNKERCPDDKFKFISNMTHSREKTSNIN